MQMEIGGKEGGMEEKWGKIGAKQGENWGKRAEMGQNWRK